jgi:alanine racemase
MKDIAERAGVSKTTVSFALNDPSRISEATFRRVMAVVAELGYVPDPVARTLTTKRLGAIGLLLPQPISEAMRNPYTCEIIRGIGEVCEEREISLTMIPPIKGSIALAARRSFADALVAIGLGPGHEAVELLRNRRIPFATIDGEESGAAYNVGVDDEAAAHSLMEYILGLGHRHIAILELAPRALPAHEAGLSAVRDRRLAGFSRALAATGLSLESPGILVSPAQASIEGGDRAATAILTGLARTATAIVAMADALALGAYVACRRLGLAIPGDMSIAGFDDVPDAILALPPLTTVRQPGREKGAAAAAMVMSLLENRRVEHCRMETLLLVRGSTAAPRLRPLAGPG